MRVQELGYKDGVLRDAGIGCRGVQGWEMPGSGLRGERAVGCEP